MNYYCCGYLKITGLTFEFPTLTTFFDAEIISKRYPFLTRKWDADMEVDVKHWVSVISFKFRHNIYLIFIINFRENLNHSLLIEKISIPMILIMNNWRNQILYSCDGKNISLYLTIQCETSMEHLLPAFIIFVSKNQKDQWRVIIITDLQSGSSHFR